MAVKVKITYKDVGLAKFIKRAEAGAGMKLQVGVVGVKAARRNEHGASYGAIALVNEFGSSDGHVPERSFIRNTMRQRGLTSSAVRIAAVAYFNLGMTLTESLARAAAPLVRAIQETIQRQVPPPNAPATIRKKGFDHPLYDTGGLEKAVGYRVVRGSGDVVEQGASLEEFESFQVRSGE